MRVLIHPADQGGCGHYRLIFPARVLAAAGHDVTVAFDRHYRAVFQPSPFGDRVIDLDETIDADIVVVQRPLHRNRVELIQVLQKRGHTVVVEIDDDFHAIHRRNPAWHLTHPKRDPDSHRDWLAKACEIADLVTVSTPALAERYGRHGRVAVLPNLVPASYLDVDVERDDRVVVGWSGSVHTHPGDLEVTDGAVARAVAETGATLAVVGTGEGVARALQLEEPPVVTGWLPIEQYPVGVAAFDVGVVPLLDSAFNEAKSNLKMSEMAALGVAAVGSPTGPNRELVAAGAGLLAKTPAEWHDTIVRLATSRQLRVEVAARGREVMRSRTYEQHADRWWTAWTAAASARRGSVAA